MHRKWCNLLSSSTVVIDRLALTKTSCNDNLPVSHWLVSKIIVTNIQKLFVQE